MPVSFKQIEKILKDLGYILIHQRGSHKKFKKSNLSITVPEHNNFKRKTAKTIIKLISSQNNIDDKDIIRDYQLKI